MPEVRFIGWESGLNKVALNDLLRQHGRLGLAEAKRMVDLLLDGGEFTVSVDDDATAERLVAGARSVGARAFVGEP